MTQILVVDDEPYNRSMMEFMLLAEGYQVAQAHDGRQALLMARNAHPDLILLDVMMPGLSGYDVADQIKDDPRTADIPIVFVSAKCEPEDLARSLEAGVDYIRKPFAEPELITRVRSVLRLRELEKELGELRPGQGRRET
jgi:CheY-like chemotaxis protein